MEHSEENSAEQNRPGIDQIVMVGLDIWDDAWMNRQSLASALTKFTNSIYVGQPRYPQGLRDLFAWPKRRVKDEITFWDLPKWMNTNFEDAHCHRGFSRRVKRRIFRYDSDRQSQALLLWHPSLVSYLETVPAEVTCCYIDDYFEGLPGTPEYLARLREQQGRMLEQVDVIFVTWQGLADKLGLGDRAVLLPHGMNFEYYNQAARNEFPTPSDIPRGRPLVGYTGSIKTKTDFELLKKMTQRLADWNIVLIGYECVNVPEQRQQFEELLKQPNFFYLGLKAYHELGAYLQAFDVCMMCYTINEWTEYGLPLKMFEYFATGKPVVSTYLPSLEDYRDFVTVCTKHDDFIAAVAEHGSNESPERRQARIDYAARNTWNHRAQTILQVLTEARQKKKR
jgi:glycosyltransferase involved in cell wall biosynthesis